MIVQDLWQAHCQMLLINFTEEIHKIKCKYGYDDKKCETRRIKSKNCECHLEYASVKDNLVIKYKCSCCNKNYQKILMKS